MAVASYIVHIRSKDCVMLSSPFTTDFEMTLSPAIQCEPEQSLSMFLVYAEIPFTFYTTNRTNNNLRIVEYDTADLSGTGQSRDLSIAVGNYTIQEFIVKIQSVLNTGNRYNDSGNYIVTHDIVTNKVSISIADSSQNRSATLDLTVPNNISRQVGMSESAHNITPSTTLVSDGRCNLATIHALYLKSNLATDNVYESKSNKNGSSIVQKIQIDVNPLEMIYFTPSDISYRSVIGKKYIDKLQFKLTDQNDDIINLGSNVNFEISVQFDVIPTPKSVFSVSSGRRRSIAPLEQDNTPPLATPQTFPNVSRVSPTTFTQSTPSSQNNPPQQQEPDEHLDIEGMPDEEDALNEMLLDKKMETIISNAKAELGIE